MFTFVQRRSLPPLNAVRAFEAVARLGSMKEAAVELSVTDGAVSQQVRLLEDWLGPPALFRRSARRVVLTPVGAALLAEFGPALDRISGAVQQHRTRRHDAPTIGLNVNALATFSLRWLLRRMAAFRAEHPDIEVRLNTSNESIDALAEPFDMVIRGGPDTFPGYRFASRPGVQWPLAFTQKALGNIYMSCRARVRGVVGRLLVDWSYRVVRAASSVAAVGVHVVCHGASLSRLQ